MPTCPAGHSSGADDYCDVCGTRMAGPPPGGGPPVSAPATNGGAPPVPSSGESCPDCSAPRTGRFCEGCGYDFAVGAGRASTPSTPSVPVVPASPPPPATDEFDEAATGRWGHTGPSAPVPAPAPSPGPARPSWTAVVVADRDYYEAVVRQSGESGAFTFPPYCPERRIPLDRPQVRIGRRSVSQGTVPEIDLSEPPEDPGASHTHAVLLGRPDGTWTLVDPGSTNGTTINGSEEPIPVNVAVPVNDGDRIHIGVWTTITLRKG